MKVLWWQLRWSSIWLQGKASSGPLSTIARSLSWGHPCGFLGIFLSASFSLNSQCLSISRYLFHCSFTLSLPQLNHPIPLCSHAPSSLLYHPLASRRSHLFHFPRVIHASLVGFSLSPSFSGALDWGLVLLYFTSSIPLWVSNTVFVFLNLGHFTRDEFFWIIPFACKFQDVIVFLHWVVLCYVNVPHFLYSFGWGASRLFPGSGFYK